MLNLNYNISKDDVRLALGRTMNRKTCHEDERKEQDLFEGRSADRFNKSDREDGQCSRLLLGHKKDVNLAVVFSSGLRENKTQIIY